MNDCFPGSDATKKTAVSATLVTFTTVFAVSEGVGFRIKDAL